ncbi:MAG TPA: pyridoxal phosphate-dependent aminotransferase [Gemmatimonadaceae bacterium]|nr:pyridoxal phosphate-dependent aminotransferase [Gemmatimonadaceae bacterium]
MPRISARVRALSGEGAFEVVARARALAAAGRDVAVLAIGEPDSPTPSHVVEAGLRALRDGATRYAAPEGIAPLRDAIAGELRARGIDACAEQVIVTPGAKAMLFYAALALIEPGDDVLVPDPGFPIYPSIVRHAGGTPVPYTLRARDFALDADRIAERITPRTRVLILNAPHNPSGGCASRAELERVAELAQRHDLLVVTDEIYGDLVYDDARRAPSIAALPGMGTRTVVVDGFSKSFAMTGWRLGYGLLPAWLVERVVTLAVNAQSCVAPFVQHAGVAALTGARNALDAMRQALRVRRDALAAGLARVPGVSCVTPMGALYAFPDVRALLGGACANSSALAARLLEEHNVAVLPGSAFGAAGEGHLRITFAASSHDIARGVAAIAALASVLRDNQEES